MNQKYNIPDFAEYLNIETLKDEDILMVLYDDKSKVPLKSEPIKIGFYLLALKLDFDDSDIYGRTDFDKTDSFLYFDAPNNTLEWDLEKPMTGYNILISSNFFDKYAIDPSVSGSITNLYVNFLLGIFFTKLRISLTNTGPLSSLLTIDG